ncbi:MAG: hypothetical protein D6793_02310 [Thermoflexia bacterium]|nr:MAG: hypothetical protein D6793_02310 [Thermoflexia bacterium]
MSVGNLYDGCPFQIAGIHRVASEQTADIQFQNDRFRDVNLRKQRRHQMEMTQSSQVQQEAGVTHQ